MFRWKTMFRFNLMDGYSVVALISWKYRSREIWTNPINILCVCLLLDLLIKVKSNFKERITNSFLPLSKNIVGCTIVYLLTENYRYNNLSYCSVLDNKFEGLFTVQHTLICIEKVNYERIAVS